MPYTSIGDLPSSISEKLPEGAQKIFIAAWNAVHKQYGSEESAFRVAWAAVGKKYRKGKDGKWTLR